MEAFSNASLLFNLLPLQFILPSLQYTPPVSTLTNLQLALLLNSQSNYPRGVPHPILDDIKVDPIKKMRLESLSINMLSQQEKMNAIPNPYTQILNQQLGINPNNISSYPSDMTLQSKLATNPFNETMIEKFQYAQGLIAKQKNFLLNPPTLNNTYPEIIKSQALSDVLKVSPYLNSVDHIPNNVNLLNEKSKNLNQAESTSLLTQPISNTEIGSKEFLKEKSPIEQETKKKIHKRILNKTSQNSLSTRTRQSKSKTKILNKLDGYDTLLRNETHSDPRRMNKLQMLKKEINQAEDEEKKRHSNEIYKFYLISDGPKDTRIGSDYQAIIPEEKRTSKEKKHIWDPDYQCELDLYFMKLEGLIGGNIIQSKVLQMLRRKDYNIDDAIKTVKKKRNYFKGVFTIQNESLIRPPEKEIN